MNLSIFKWWSLKTKMTIFTLTIFLISIWSLAFYASQLLYKDMQRLSGDQQYSTASYIAAAVNEELENRLESMRGISDEVTPAILANPTLLQELLEKHPFFQSLFNGGTYITGMDGTATASLPLSADRIGVNYMDRDHIVTALKKGKATISRPYVGRMLHVPIFSMATPIRDPQGEVIGALTGVVDLSKPNFLDKISENRYGKTGGYMLVAPQNRLIVTATDKSQILETLPAPGINPLMDRFIQGYEGSGVGTNTLGVEELVSAKGIPVAGWYVAVSQPTVSAFAPIHSMQERILLATILMTILVVGLTWWMLRHLLSPMAAAVKYLAIPSNTNQAPHTLQITHQDEIGDLIGGFNQLLETLAQRDEALRANRKQLSDIIKFLPTATLAIDKDGRVIIWNEAIEQMTGIPAAEMLGKNDYAHSIPFHGEAKPLLLNLIIEDNSEMSLPYHHIIHKNDILSAEVFCSALYDNKGAWVFAKAAPLHDQDGNIIGAIESVRDITERKLAETYGAIGREILHILNEPGDLRNAVQRVLAILKSQTGFDAVGIRLQEGEDYPYFVQDGFSSDFLAKENSLMARTMDGDLCRDQEGRVKLECICGLVLSGKIDPTNPLFTLGGSCWTNDSNLLLEISSSDDPRLNPRNQCVYYNYASVALVPIRDKERIIGLIQFNDRRKEAFTLSMIEHLESIATHLGAALMRKQTEEETKALQSQLLQAQKMEAIGTLAGGIAHDFNNILGAIIGYTELATACIPQEAEATRHLGKVMNASERAATLVKQILAFSRQANIEKIPLKPRQIVEEAIKLLRPSLPSTIKINQKIDTATKSILADPTQVHQILMNLCTNAFHAMEQTGGTLEITLQDTSLASEDLQHKPEIQPGAFVLLSVRDTGPGIPQKIRDKIFDPYFTTKAAGKGTGMGLAITLGIITSYGGFLTCESEIGKGTVFEIYFPAINQEIASNVGSVEISLPGTEHILLVDDELLLADLGTMILEGLGYTVTMRTSSLEALALFQSQPEQFDAVITDQTMPDMTGMDLAKRMLQIRPELPIILCTGYSNLITGEEAKAEGVKGFIEKPMTKKAIATLLRKILDDRSRS